LNRGQIRTEEPRGTGVSDLATDFQKYLLDHTKISYHQERIEAWERGEKIAPITIDMALTRACNYGCHFCYAMLQENNRVVITREAITRFIDDCAEIGVKAISLVSDGESTLSPQLIHTIQYGHSKGIHMALGTNAYLLDEVKLRSILPSLTYLRVNFTGGERERYAELMGVKPEYFDKVCENIKTMRRIKDELKIPVTIGMQFVLDPRYADQIIPFAKLGKELGPDYAVIKHCSDDEDGSLGVDYEKYEAIYPLLEEAEALSTGIYQVTAKWSKIGDKGKRSYQRCYGPPFLLQISGSGLVAPCGMLFNEQYKKFHIGNIVTESFKEMVRGDRYWEVVNYLASPNFNAQSMCGSLCLQHKVNEYLDGRKKGHIQSLPTGEPPEHLNFV
jgi:MoaA/NifB/PqqE/SkfB family radical SAM enzyme